MAISNFEKEASTEEPKKCIKLFGQQNLRAYCGCFSTQRHWSMQSTIPIHRKLRRSQNAGLKCKLNLSRLESALLDFEY